jgi:hypothetical protein
MPPMPPHMPPNRPSRKNPGSQPPKTLPKADEENLREALWVHESSPRVRPGSHLKARRAH